MHPFSRLALITSVAGTVLLAPIASATAANTVIAHWTLDEVNSSIAHDVSGHGNDGTNYNVVGNGTGYLFNGSNSRVIVPNSASLNPGAANFSFGVTVVMSHPPTAGGSYDVLRKGLVTSSGGDYKFEVLNSSGNAIGRCVTKTVKAGGTKVLAGIQHAKNLADGKPHTIVCTKTSTSISIKVDGLAPRTKHFSSGLGSVSNTSNLALGAKAEDSASSGFDWYEGRINDAWVAKG